MNSSNFNDHGIKPKIGRALFKKIETKKLGFCSIVCQIPSVYWDTWYKVNLMAPATSNKGRSYTQYDPRKNRTKLQN